MTTKRLVLFGLIVAAVAGVAIASVGRRCTRPTCLTGIPRRDYQFRSRSQPKMLLSKTRILLERPAGGGLPRKRIRFYQLAQRKVQIEHCSISRVVLQL
ncbi:MAG: hypothetical protein ACYSWU_03805, partial [Planctomycetota bacterium]